MKLSAIFPVFGNASSKETEPVREPRSLSRRGSDAVMSGKNIIMQGAKNTAEMVRKKAGKLKRRMSESQHDTDLSDKHTREQHRLVVRSDGTAVIKAMQSTQNVVRKFKLRSNSIATTESTLGALQAAEATIKNVEMEVVALKKVREEK